MMYRCLLALFDLEDVAPMLEGSVLMRGELQSSRSSLVLGWTKGVGTHLAEEPKLGTLVVPAGDSTAGDGMDDDVAVCPCANLTC